MTTQSSRTIPLATVLVLYFLCPLVFWSITSGHAWEYVLRSPMDGQFTYLTAKLLGLYALFALALQTGLGLFGLPRMTSVGLRWHRILGSLSLALVSAHVLSFLLATWQRNGMFPMDFFVPSFASGYYKSMLSIGLIAFVLMLLTYLAAAARGKVPRVLWIAAHRLGIVGIALGFWHALAIGSEIRLPGLLTIVILMIVAIAAAVVSRFARAVAKQESM